jgi:hypothetical protein
VTPPSCQHQVYAPGGVCPICGAFVQTGEVQSAANSPAASAVTPLPAHTSRVALLLHVMLSILCWLLIFVANYFIAIRWSGRFDSETQGYMLGGCIAALLFSCFVVWLYYRKKPTKPSSSKMAFLISVWALVFTIPHFIGSKEDSAEYSDAGLAQRMAVLMKEAAGELPPSPLKEKWEGPARDFYKDVIQLNREYQKEVDELDNAELANLYSPASYATSAKMARILAELRATEVVDTKQYAALKPLMESLKNRIRALDISENEKEEFVRGVEKGIMAESSDRERVYAKEKDWLDQSIDLYQFALDNKKSFTVHNNAVSSRFAGFRDSFRSKQARAISLKEDFIAAQTEFESKRKSRLEKMGLRPADVGDKEPAAQPATTR